MAQEMVKAEEKAVAVRDDDPFIVMAERLAGIHNLDAETVDRLLAAQERVLDREARNEFYDAMNRVQSELPMVLNDAENAQTSSRYAKLETINRAIKPIYTKAGFSTSFWEGKAEREGFIRIEGRLRHRAGHSEDGYSVEVPPDKTGIKGNVNKTDIHAAGSAFKYGRRYLTCLMFDVSTGDEDDDGNAAGAATITESQVADLEAKIEEVGADLAKFLSVAKVDSLDQILADRYDKAIQWLERYAKSK